MLSRGDLNEAAEGRGKERSGWDMWEVGMI